MLRLFGERGGDPDRPGKGDELDALLWRAERPGEPSWPSPFGPGRPGWHVECAAIALDRIGTGLDIQGGGSDLIFPHHEFSAAHAESVTGERRFARHYVHAGMIGWDGHKMSKSRGNLVLVSRLRADGVEPVGHPAGAARRALPRGPVVDRRRAGGGAGPAGPVARGDRAAGRSRRHRCDRPGAHATSPTISTRPKRLPPLMVGYRCARVRRSRRRGAARRCATAVDALLGVDLPSARRADLPARWAGGVRFAPWVLCSGKVVFITGGAAGVGAEVARRLHAKGAKLVLTDVDADAARPGNAPHWAPTGC